MIPPKLAKIDLHVSHLTALNYHRVPLGMRQRCRHCDKRAATRCTWRCCGRSYSVKRTNQIVELFDFFAWSDVQSHRIHVPTTRKHGNVEVHRPRRPKPRTPFLTSNKAQGRVEENITNNSQQHGQKTILRKQGSKIDRLPDTLVNI
ncbi:unnamed protein product [Ectocarpus fasciculatus]